MEPNTSTPLKFKNDFYKKKNFKSNLMREDEDDATDGQVKISTEAEKESNKGTRFLSTKAVQLLNKWFMENKNYPYPDESITEYLAQQADISTKQVKKWFANKRVRSQLCCKSINRNKKKFKVQLYDLNRNKQENTSINYDSNKKILSSSTSSPSASSSISTSSLSPSSGSSLYTSSPPSPSQTLLTINSQPNKNRKFLKKSLKRNNLKEIESSVNSIQQLWLTKNYPTLTLPVTSSLLLENGTCSPVPSNLAKTSQATQYISGSSVDIQPYNNNNTLLLKSMAYYNPLMMMNLLASNTSSLSSSSSCSYTSSFDTSLPTLSHQNQETNNSLLAQNNKNCSNLIMLMMMSKYSKEMNRNSINSSLTIASPLSSSSLTSSSNSTIEMSYSPNQNYQKNKTNFAIISTLID